MNKIQKPFSLNLAVTFLSLVLFLNSGCQTTVQKPEPSPQERPQSRTLEDPLTSIQNRLGLNKSREDLGFEERSFNTCEIGLDQAGSCKTKSFFLLHLQLLCRQSEGTLQSAPQLYPIKLKNMSWKMGAKSGLMKTDSYGFAQISGISEQSVRTQRLIIREGANFVGFTAEDISKVVLPKNWCN